MKNFINPILIGLILTLISTQSHSQNSCVKLLSTNTLTSHLHGVQEKHPWLQKINDAQEIVWELEAIGELSKAQRLTALIEKELKNLEQTTWPPKSWQLISTEKNMNKVYRLQLNGIDAVVKFGQRAVAIEPLAYQVAKLLNVPAPISLPITIGGERATAQVFLQDWETALPSNAEPNLLLKFFDYLILNSDRNKGNYMVPALGRESIVQQVAIDHEYAFNTFNFNENSSQSANPFLLKHLETIKRQFPHAHTALQDPETLRLVTALLSQSQLSRKGDFIKHMEKGLKAYQNISRLFRNLAPQDKEVNH